MTLPVPITPKPQVDLSHHRIHEGNHFTIDIVRDITTISLLSPKYILIITPPMSPLPSDIVTLHFIYTLSSNNFIEVQFFEDATVLANGKPIPIINANRNSLTTSDTQAFEDPIVITEGTKIFDMTSVVPGQLIGELERDEDEKILKIQTNYLLKITPILNFPFPPPPPPPPTPPAIVNIGIDWYDQRPSSPVPV